MKPLFNFFLRGLLLVFPVGATLYIIQALVRWADDLLSRLLFEPFAIDIPGLGLITVFFLVAFLGFLGTLAFTRPVLTLFERLLMQMPLVRMLYTSIKELTQAFLGDKKRFNRPVLMNFNDSGVKRIGFITQEDLTQIGVADLVAVYCPHSYNFSGNLFLVPAESVTPLTGNSAEIMKFVVSAGITRINSGNN